MSEKKLGILLAALALALAGWVLFWYVPRPLMGEDRPRTIQSITLWVAGADRDLTDRVDEELLRTLLEQYRCRPAFGGDYFPYSLDAYPLTINFRDQGKVWYIILGEYGAAASDGGALAWPVLEGKTLFQEVSALLPQES